MLVKIGNGGKVELYDDNGRFKVQMRCYGAAIDADVRSDGMIVVTTDNGGVELRDSSGRYKGHIVQRGAVSARWSGNNVAVRLPNGKIELRDEKGCYKGTI